MLFFSIWQTFYFKVRVWYKCAKNAEILLQKAREENLVFLWNEQNYLDVVFLLHGFKKQLCK